MIFLETERLLFRDHEPTDLDAYCAMEADPEVRRYVGGAPRTREAAERKFQGIFPRSPRLAMRATVFKPEGCYIGYCGLYPHLGPAGEIPGEAVLGFTLARKYWGRGLASEAGAAFIALGFGDLRLERIAAVAEVGNARSIRVLAKLGFRRTRTEAGVRSFHHFELTASATAPAWVILPLLPRPS